MLGCLFILIFGVLFFAVGVLRMFYQMFFGHSPRTSQQQWTRGSQTRQDGSARSRTNYTAGDAHHEGSRPNSRQRRSGKIFEKNEGQYVDFEEV